VLPNLAAAGVELVPLTVLLLAGRASEEP
jgi:hypothetical protein